MLSLVTSLRPKCSECALWPHQTIRVWIPSLHGETGGKLYWHVATPIRLFKKVNYIFTPSQMASLCIYGHEDLC